MYKKLFGLFTLIMATQSVAEAALSKEDVRTILRRSRGMTQMKADAIIQKIEDTFGSVDGQHLNISAFLSGNRFNFGVFYDRKSWKFDATYNPRGTDEVVTVSNLVRAEVFNSGIKAKLGWDWMWIALPKDMSIEDLNGYATSKGMSVSGTWLGKKLLTTAFPTIVPFQSFYHRMLIPDIAAGIIPADYGTIGIFTLGLGLNMNYVTFPQIVFSLNKGALRRKF